MSGRGTACLRESDANSTEEREHEEKREAKDEKQRAASTTSTTTIASSLFSQVRTFLHLPGAEATPPTTLPRLSTDTAAARSFAEGAAEGEDEEEANGDFDIVDDEEKGKASSSARASTAASMAPRDGADDDKSMVLACEWSLQLCQAGQEKERKQGRETRVGRVSLFSLYVSFLARSLTRLFEKNEKNEKKVLAHSSSSLWFFFTVLKGRSLSRAGAYSLSSRKLERNKPRRHEVLVLSFGPTHAA